MSCERPEPRPKWHVERGIPLSLIAGLAVHLAVYIALGSYWVAQVDARQNAFDTHQKVTDTRVADLAGIIAEIKRDNDRQEINLARKDEQYSNIEKLLGKLDMKMDRLQAVVK